MIKTVYKWITEEDIKESRRMQSLLEVDLKLLDRALTFVLTLIILALLAITMRYEGNAQLGPLFILGLLLILVIGLMARQADVFGDQESVLGEPGNFVGGFGRSVGEKSDDSDESFDLYERRVELVKSIFWVLFLLVGSWLFGLATASTVFLILFLRYEAKQPWPHIIGIIVGVMGFIIIVFHEFLGAGLYTGIFDIEIIDLITGINL